MSSSPVIFAETRNLRGKGGLLAGTYPSVGCSPTGTLCWCCALNATRYHSTLQRVTARNDANGKASWLGSLHGSEENTGNSQHKIKLKVNETFMTSNPGSGRGWGMLAAPVKLSMLLTLEADCSLLPTWSCVQAATATQPQICWNSPFSCPQSKLGSVLSSEQDELIIFWGGGFTVFLHLKAKLWFAFLSKCAAPVPWKAGVGTWGTWAIQLTFTLPPCFFSRNKQGLRPNLLYTYCKYQPKVGMLE